MNSRMNLRVPVVLCALAVDDEAGMAEKLEVGAHRA